MFTPIAHLLRFRLAALTSGLGLLSMILGSGVTHAAGTFGNVKVLGIRVAFADFNNAPSLETIGNRLQGAKVSYGRYSYGKLNITYDTVAVSLPQNRGSYTASSLANAAETRAGNKGFNIGSYDIVGFYHGGHASGNKAIVGGKRFWTTNGGATIHEMGHNFNWGHQSRWVSSNDNPTGPGEPVTPDMWHFMANSSTDADPYDKWTKNWITARYNITSDGSYTRRLYTFDQKDTDPANDRRVLRVTRNTSTSAAFWIGFRSRLMNNQNSGATGKNYHLRQGLAFYWDRGTNGGQNVVLLDMHPSVGGWDDHSLQPGETYSDNAGGVHITNLGRGGASPGEYVDVRINKGEFPGNQPPAPTWDAPATWEAGVPLTITVTPNDPDGDEVACMWTTADKKIPYNRSSNTLTKTWDLAGSYRVKAVVSDMKGQTATLARTITVTGDYPVTFADAQFGPWAGDVSNTAWTADILVDGNVAATANVFVTNLTGDFDTTKTSVAGITDNGKSLARVVLWDPVNTPDVDEPASGASVRFAVTNVQPVYILNGVSMTSSGAVWAPEQLASVQFDGADATVVDGGLGINLIGGGVGATPQQLSSGGTVNFAEPASWNNASGFGSAAHSVAWSIDAPGSSFLSGDYTTEPAPALAKEQLAFGVSLSPVPDETTITYGHWAQTISGLAGPEAAFDFDVNGDGVANGLAFLFGAEDAQTDAGDMLPSATHVGNEFVFTFRRLEDAALTVQSAAEYSSAFDGWTTAMDGIDGVTITEEDDFYEPGIDRVEVRLPAALGSDGKLFLRLRAGQ